MSSKPFFEQVAEQWDEMRKNFYADSVREKAFTLAALQPDSLVADIGAGSGFITEGLVKRGVKVIAVDQSPAMLQRMREKFAQGIDYRLGEAENLPIESESVDYVFANMYLHHVEQPDKAIIEMARILKPNGKLVITDADKHNFEFLRIEHHDVWLGFERTDIEQWFIAAGLQRVMVKDIDERCSVDAKCGETQADINIFIALGEK